MPIVRVNVGYDNVIEEFEAITRDADQVQRETLKKIIERNSATEYLDKWGVNGSTEPQEFKAKVPLATHADLEPYILRLTDGDQYPLLTTQPISVFSLSSGTTDGRPKFVPINDEMLTGMVQVFRISAAYRARKSFHIGLPSTNSRRHDQVLKLGTTLHSTCWGRHTQRNSDTTPK